MIIHEFCQFRYSPVLQSEASLPIGGATSGSNFSIKKVAIGCPKSHKIASVSNLHNSILQAVIMARAIMLWLRPKKFLDMVRTANKLRFLLIFILILFC